MNLDNDGVKDDLQQRLKRVEGQVRGVQRMLDENRDCQAVLQQLTAIRSAVNQASLILVRAHATQCLLSPFDDETPEQMVDKLVSTLAGFPLTTLVQPLQAEEQASKIS